MNLRLPAAGTACTVRQTSEAGQHNALECLSTSQCVKNRRHHLSLNAAFRMRYMGTGTPDLWLIASFGRMGNLMLSHFGLLAFDSEEQHSIVPEFAMLTQIIDCWLHLCQSNRSSTCSFTSRASRKRPASVRQCPSSEAIEDTTCTTNVQTVYNGDFIWTAVSCQSFPTPPLVSEASPIPPAAFDTLLPAIRPF